MYIWRGNNLKFNIVIFFTSFYIKKKKKTWPFDLTHVIMYWYIIVFVEISDTVWFLGFGSDSIILLKGSGFGFSFWKIQFKDYLRSFFYYLLSVFYFCVLFCANKVIIDFLGFYWIYCFGIEII